MSLSASEARALTRIERALLARDPVLRSLFSTFTSLTWREAMPAWEQRPEDGIASQQSPLDPGQGPRLRG